MFYFLRQVLNNIIHIDCHHIKTCVRNRLRHVLLILVFFICFLPFEWFSNYVINSVTHTGVFARSYLFGIRRTSFSHIQNLLSLKVHRVDPSLHKILSIIRINQGLTNVIKFNILSKALFLVMIGCLPYWSINIIVIASGLGWSRISNRLVLNILLILIRLFSRLLLLPLLLSQCGFRHVAHTTWSLTGVIGYYTCVYLRHYFLIYIFQIKFIKN